MTARLVLATRNEHKVAELRRILAEAGVEVELVSVAGLEGVPDVAETSLTFAGNALLKARAVVTATGLPAVADDSGLAVEALNQMPGVFSARWSGRHGDDPANVALLLAQVAEVPAELLQAAFVCAAALVTPAGTEVVEEGRLTGSLARRPRGSHGFGYDPIFVPDGDTRTLAEFGPDQKDAISHRGRAFRALAHHLQGGAGGGRTS